MDHLLIFKQTALDADLNFLEQYDLIDLTYDAQNTSGMKVVLIL